jgi:hypothetical protein
MGHWLLSMRGVQCAAARINDVLKRYFHSYLGAWGDQVWCEAVAMKLCFIIVT